MSLSSSEAAIGLYRYHVDLPEPHLFEQFYSDILEWLTCIGVVPTYIGVDGKGYSEKLTRFGGKAHNRITKSGFGGIRSLTLVANPAKSDAPAFDGFMYASFGYLETSQELLMCFAINEAFIGFRTAEYENVLRSFVGLCKWDFGYGFSANVDKHAELHILGASSGELSAEEQDALNTWYAAPAEVRTALLRDVYPYNILNEKQLNAEIGNGVTLRQFAGQQAGCSVAPLTDYGLHLWQVSDDAKVAELRKELAGSRALVP